MAQDVFIPPAAASFHEPAHLGGMLFEQGQPEAFPPGNGLTMVLIANAGLILPIGDAETPVVVSERRDWPPSQHRNNNRRLSGSIKQSAWNLGRMTTPRYDFCCSCLLSAATLREIADACGAEVERITPAPVSNLVRTSRTRHP